MNRVPRSALLVPALVAAALWAGCDSEPGSLVPNQPPNTRLSSAPPEASDASFEVNLFWFGWDDDGFVDHYEIAWETPDDWEGPVFGNDSLFIVEARDTCCVEPLPDYITPLPDSVYSQYHTVFIRAVDNNGAVDETPAFRSFNAKTIAPYTEIVDPSPRELGQWGSQVEFNWRGSDDDGLVVGYLYALTQLEDFVRDTGEPIDDLSRVVAWLDTLTYYPDFAGGYYTDSLVWRFTEEDSVFFPNVNATPPPNKAIFGIRAIDDAGATERILTRRINTRVFQVTRALDGPTIFMTSNILGSFAAGQVEVREVFAGQGIRFEWRATPGPSGAAVAGFSHAVDDTTNWTPFSITDTEYPEQVPGEPEALWFPDEGPHTFFVRAIDEAGFINVLAARLRVFAGPRFCPLESRYVLVVVDTNPQSLQNSFIWPVDYPEVELGLIQYYFDGYDYQIHETDSTEEPSLALLDCASSTFWFLSAYAQRAGGDASVMESYHKEPPSPLPSYVASGGNLFLCGLAPSNAVRYQQSAVDGSIDWMGGSSVEVNFQSTLTDTTVLDHWMASQFGISRIERAVGNSNVGADATRRLRIARSQITTGANPYPDLVFDPLTWPQGPLLRGFGFYDLGIIPIDTTLTEPIYRANDGTSVVGVRRLTSPGVNGNLIYLGFHPYFVERPAFRDFIRAVLTEFGEFPVP